MDFSTKKGLSLAAELKSVYLSALQAAAVNSPHKH